MHTWSLHSRILQFLWENIISLLTYQRISADVWKYFGCVPMNFGCVPMAVRRRNRILLQGFPYHELHVREEGNLLSRIEFDWSTVCDAMSRENHECATEWMKPWITMFYTSTTTLQPRGSNIAVSKFDILYLKAEDTRRALHCKV